MKTAISVEDSLMEEADRAAKELGLSRSALVSEALRGFLKLRRDQEITEQLNQVYAGEPSAEDRALVKKFKTKIPIADRW